MHVRWPGGPEQVDVHVLPDWAMASAVAAAKLRSAMVTMTILRIGSFPRVPGYPGDARK